MKTERNNIIKITEKITSFHFLKNTRTGGEVSASVTERINNRQAVLNIAGSRVKAEFLNGVPDGNRLHLILEEKGGGIYLFKLIESTDKNNFFDKIFDFSIFNISDLNKMHIPALMRFIKEGLLDVFSFNCLFLKIIGNKVYKTKGIADILNRLLNLGMMKEDLILLSHLLSSGKGINIDFINTIMIIFGIDNNYLSKIIKYVKDEKSIREKIYNLFEKINSLKINKNDENEIIKQIIDIILNNGKFSINDTKTGEIPYFDDNSYKSLKYILKNNAFICSLELSYLGVVEILVKNYKSNINISIFCENNRSLEVLKDRVDVLYSGLKNMLNEDIIVQFFNSKSVVEKIIDINSFGISNSALDIKV